MRAWILAGVMGVVGCSVLVDPTSEIRCEVEVGCPDGQVCDPLAAGATEGICRDACIPPGRPEECNGLDDDCDGMVDEGIDVVSELCNTMDDDCDGRIDEGNDLDGDGVISASESFDRDDDGFNQCGTDQCLDPDSACTFDPDRVDCNDDDAAIHPAANEECDATDHNCDGAAFPPGEPDASCRAPRDELCGGGQICEVDRGCIPLDCASGRACAACGPRQSCEAGRCVDLDCDPAICEGMNQFCDSSSPACQDRKPNGADCNRDIECQSGFCAPGNMLGLPVTGVCFSACCDDAQCPAGQYCYDSRTGARSCMIPRPDTGRTSVGTGGPDAPCSSGADCRSGRCVDGRCMAACGQSSDCPAACGVTSDGLACRGGGDLGAPCSDDAQCAMDTCVDGICVFQACTESTACRSISTLVPRCDYIAVGSPLAAAPSCLYFNRPAVLVEEANRGHGEACEVDFCESSEQCCATPLCLVQLRHGCESGVCVNNRCTRACCDDSTCARFGEVCRPTRVSIEGVTFFPMYCLPPS